MTKGRRDDMKRSYAPIMDKPGYFELCVKVSDDESEDSEEGEVREVRSEG